MSVAFLFIKCSQLSIFSSYFHSIVERPERTERQSTKKTLLGREWGLRYSSCSLRSHTPSPLPRTSRTPSLAFSVACVNIEAVNSLEQPASRLTCLDRVTRAKVGEPQLGDGKKNEAIHDGSFCPYACSHFFLCSRLLTNGGTTDITYLE